MKARWLLALLLACACGGKAGKNASEGASDASGVAGSPNVVEPTCADTLRTGEDEAENAKVLDMAAHGDPNTLVPLLIVLVQVETTPGANEAERTRAFEPYQAPIVTKLTEWGVPNVERFWLTNSLAASVPLRYIDELLCLPHVVSVQTDAPYWEIVERPWSADEAGMFECPLEGEQCPDHCFDYEGIAFDEAAGCYQGRVRVGCAITTPAFSDGAAGCFEHIASGKTYLFYGLPPVEPNFIGWQPCDPALTTQRCAP